MLNMLTWTKFKRLDIVTCINEGNVVTFC